MYCINIYIENTLNIFFLNSNFQIKSKELIKISQKWTRGFSEDELADLARNMCTIVQQRKDIIKYLYILVFYGHGNGISWNDRVSRNIRMQIIRIQGVQR